MLERNGQGKRRGRVEKLRLAVTQQPPDIFYNQKFGNAHAMDIGVALEGKLPDAVVQHSRLWPLKVTLLYENMKEVANQGIMQFMEVPELDTDTMSATIHVRINEVSSAHQRQRFRFRIVLEFPKGMAKAAAAVTEATKVLSKTNTSSNKRRRVASRAEALEKKEGEVGQTGGPAADGPQEQEQGTAEHPVVQLCQDILQALVHHNSQWQVVGRRPGKGRDDDEEGLIRKCPLCAAVHTAAKPGAHDPSCQFLQLASRYASIRCVQPEALELPPVQQEEVVSCHPMDPQPLLLRKISSPTTWHCPRLSPSLGFCTPVGVGSDVIEPTCVRAVGTFSSTGSDCLTDHPLEPLRLRSESDDLSDFVKHELSPLSGFGSMGY